MVDHDNLFIGGAWLASASSERIAVEDPTTQRGAGGDLRPGPVGDPYADEEEALEIANNSQYGLHGAVWAGTEEHALAFARRMQTGTVDVNGGRYNPVAPFGGYKQSGVGREMGEHGLTEFLQTKAIQL